MQQSVSSLFSTADRERIAAAVRQAESRTSGEIVPFAVGRSDSYEEADWRCSALLGTAALAAFSIIYSYTSIWLPLNVAELVIIALIAGVVGVFLPRAIPSLKRLFAGNELMDRRVAQRATEAFVSEEVFKTRDRTGILIFLSMLEHKVLVLGDSGINAKVKPEDWNDIVNRIVSGIRSGKTVEGLLDGIERCGMLLQRHGVAIRQDDTDELPDSLRTDDK